MSAEVEELCRLKWRSYVAEVEELCRLKWRSYDG